MRYLFGFLCVCALGIMPLVGCSETTGDGGGGGTAGTGGLAGSGGTGGVPQCQSPEDCDDDNECTDDTCLAGVCEFMPVPDPTGPEEPGDPPGEGTTCGYYEGTCEGGSCVGTFACTEAGIREAIAAGAGPHTFACNGATTVVTQAPIEIDNDVILDGAGEVTVDGNFDHHVFSVPVGVTAELQGFTVTNGVDDPNISGAGGIRIDTNATVTLTDTTVSGNTGGWAGGITNNRGTLTLSSSTVSDNTGSGIVSTGPLTLTDSTVSGNVSSNAASGGGIVAYDITLLVNSTISGNSSSGGPGGAINTCKPMAGGCNPLTLISSTIAGNIGEPSIVTGDASMSVTNSLVDGDCDGDVTSNGYNIESPGNTCGFDQTGDQSGVTTEQLNLGELAANGGPTMTHALLTEPIVSVAVDVIPADDCVAADGGLLQDDQRGEPRFVFPSFGLAEPVGDGCDVGAFEVQPEP